MPGSVLPYLHLRKLATGRRLFALAATRKEAAGDAKLLKLIDAASAHDRQTLALELEWNRTKGDASEARGDAMVFDTKIDELLAAIEAIARAQAVGDAKDPVVKAARAFVPAVFPLGLAPITQLAFELQLTTVDALVTSLKTTLAADVKLLGLGRQVALLEEYNAAFRKELEGAKARLSFDKVAAAQAEGQELLGEVVAVILGTHHGRDAATTTKREALLAEVNRQNALVEEAFRRKRRPVDVDPDTGEPVADAAPPVPPAQS